MLLAHHRAKVFGAAFDGSNQERLGEVVTGTNTYRSLPVRLPVGSGLVSAQVFWTGTPTGTLTAWFSNMASPDLTTDADWNEDTGFAAVAGDPAGSASSTFVPGAGAAGAWWRLRYVNASGSGTLAALITIGD